MEIIESIEELKASYPELLFKYRDWSNAFHKEIISEQIVYMSPPSQFEDEKDCKNFRCYDNLTDSQIFKYCFKLIRDNTSSGNRSSKRREAERMVKSGLLKDREYIKRIQAEDFEEFNKRFGVLCLTANPKNYEMWVKYSNNHKGFCVGIDSKELFKYVGGGGSVNYVNHLPKILINDTFEQETYKQVFYKESKWAFEEEYRTHMFYKQPASENERRIRLSKDCFKIVLVGSAMPKEEIYEIVKSCEEQELNVKFYQIGWKLSDCK